MSHNKIIYNLIFGILIVLILLVLNLISINLSDITGRAVYLQADEEYPEPVFAINASGIFVRYITPTRKEGDVRYFSDENLEAEIEKIDDEYELRINAKKEVKKIYFPWEDQKYSLDSNLEDDVVYYPYLFGTATKADSVCEWCWRGGLDYPGTSFAPLMVIADDSKAKIMAATNWPPKKVKPMYSLQRMTMVYDETINPGDSKNYRVFINEYSGDSSQGNIPWQLALDDYKDWLDEKMDSSGLNLDYPTWMKEIHGFYNVQLQNIWDFKNNFAKVKSNWENYKDILPWIQFWGQMSSYNGSCCDLKEEINVSYNPELLDFAQGISRDQEKHVGYYSRPRPVEEYGNLENNLLIDGKTNSESLLYWQEKNKEGYYANAYYIDTLGAVYYGDGLFVANFIKEDLSKDTFIEYPVDIYPSAFLISGSLGSEDKNGPGKTPDNFDKSFSSVTYPNFGRYLLNDRIVFLGESNTGYKFWGESNNHWAERQAFLLGAKFDAMTPNSVVREVSEKRENIDWWQRELIYLDRKGIYNVPEGVDVRRFIDKDGKNLFVIDNWNLLEGRSFNFQENTINISQQKISIIDYAYCPGGICRIAEICGDKVCNNDENCSSCSGDCGNCTSQIQNQTQNISRNIVLVDNLSSNQTQNISIIQIQTPANKTTSSKFTDFISDNYILISSSAVIFLIIAIVFIILSFKVRKDFSEMREFSVKSGDRGNIKEIKGGADN